MYEFTSKHFVSVCVCLHASPPPLFCVTTMLLRMRLGASKYFESPKHIQSNIIFDVGVYFKCIWVLRSTQTHSKTDDTFCVQGLYSQSSVFQEVPNHQMLDYIGGAIPWHRESRACVADAHLLVSCWVMALRMRFPHLHRLSISGAGSSHMFESMMQP